MNCRKRQLNRVSDLLGRKVTGDYGQETCGPDEVKFIRDKVRQTHEREIAELSAKLEALRALYAQAAKSGHSMLSVVI